MTKNQCRICRKHEKEQQFDQIAPYHAQLLLEFGIKIPKRNICSTICNECSVFLENYDIFKVNCEESTKYFDGIEGNSSGKVEEPGEIVEMYEEGELLGEEDPIEEEEPKEKVEYFEELLEELEEGPSIVVAHACDCGATFQTSEELQVHLKTHETDPPPRKKQRTTHQNFRCKICRNQCFNEDRLKLHMERHRTLSFHCEKCSKEFKREKELAKHMKLIHPVVATYYECKACDLAFREESDLETHILGVHYSEPHHLRCTYCAKVCRSEAHLRTHSLKHETYEFEEHLEAEITPAEPITAQYDAAQINYEAVVAKERPKLRPPSVKVNIL